MSLAYRLDGELTSGGSSYTLHLPKDIPAALFWSLTLYEAENASGLANGQPFPSLGSRNKPETTPTARRTSTSAPIPRRQGTQLAGDPAGPWLFHHPASLRSDRKRDQQVVEAGGYREGEMN